MKAIYEKKISEKYALENNLSIDEMNKMAQEIYESYDADKFADDDARWSRAYRRVRGALREKARNMTHSVDGMIVCRMTDKDFNRKQYDYAMFIAETKGKEQALKDKLINEDGQPLYKWGDDAGKVILGDDKKPGRPLASGRAIGYTFEKDEEGNYTIIEPRYIVIGKDKSEDTIPVCQIGKLLLSIADKKQNGFFANNNFAYYNDASLSNEHKTPYTFDEVKEILGQWNHVFGDNFAAISNVKDLQSFVDEHAYSKDNKDNEYDFCAIPGIVSAIIPNESKYGNARVVLEFIDYDTLETSLLTVFLPQPMLKGLSMKDDDQGIFILQASLNSDNKSFWHLGGFLHIDDSVAIEEFFGVHIEGEDV